MSIESFALSVCRVSTRYFTKKTPKNKKQKKKNTYSTAHKKTRRLIKQMIQEKISIVFDKKCSDTHKFLLVRREIL